MPAEGRRTRCYRMLALVLVAAEKALTWCNGTVTVENVKTSRDGMSLRSIPMQPSSGERPRFGASSGGESSETGWSAMLASAEMEGKGAGSKLTGQI